MASQSLTIIVGADFGTTRSGASYSKSDNPSAIEGLTRLGPRGKNRTDEEKVPTTISYDANGLINSWAHQRKTGPREVAWFKLLLSQEGKMRLLEQQGDWENTEGILQSLGKSPLDVTADYLQVFWGSILEQITDKFGETVTKSANIKVVLTVPAIWDHNAQELTRTAARQAGITQDPRVKLEMVSEPEAAARWCLHQNPMMKVGDCFTICDAGGGTIDLVSYRVTQLKPLLIEMCSRPTGSMNGAVFLDTAFLKLVAQRLGADTFSNIDAYSQNKIMAEWEFSMKRSFSTSIDEEYYVDVPADHRGGRDSTYFRVENWELKRIFEPVCAEAARLVEGQFKQVGNRTGRIPKAIFLVGGFGASDYLREFLQKRFYLTAVLRPQFAPNAIARGAVLKGAQDHTVVNHIAKYHYGTCYSREFDPTIDHEIEAFPSLKHGNQRRVNACMRWYLKQGTSVEKTQPIRFSWVRKLERGTDLKSQRFIVFYCSSETAPEKKNQDVLTLCQFNIDFSFLNYTSLPLYRRPGNVRKNYRELHYDVVMRISSGSIDWEIWTQGQQVGRKSVNLEWKNT